MAQGSDEHRRARDEGQKHRDAYERIDYLVDQPPHEVKVDVAQKHSQQSRANERRPRAQDLSGVQHCSLPADFHLAAQLLHHGDVCWDTPVGCHRPRLIVPHQTVVVGDVLREGARDCVPAHLRHELALVALVVRLLAGGALLYADRVREVHGVGGVEDFRQRGGNVTPWFAAPEDEGGMLDHGVNTTELAVEVEPVVESSQVAVSPAVVQHPAHRNEAKDEDS
mmetsp:Transcript_104538/g.312185  ORF Transcript_104538/g.312185 Transcript_104538/m.312185 type:complete len:224 (+) Transcript_104538:1238-1909(+)